MAQEEGRRARKRYKNAPSYDEVKAKIDAKEKAAAERKSERAAAKKPLTPAERYEQEKAARKDKSGGFSQHRMTGSRGHGSEYRVPSRFKEEFVVNYLLDEGFASDEKSAEAIMCAMSEAWIESIVEGAAGAFVPSKMDDSNNRRDMLKNRYGQDVSPRIPGPSGGGQFEKPSSNPSGALRLAKTSSKGDTKTA